MMEQESSSAHQSHLLPSESCQDDFLKNLWAASPSDYSNNNLSSNHQNQNLTSDISISASSNNGDSNSNGLSPPEMHSASASNHSNSDPDSPHSLREFIFSAHAHSGKSEIGGYEDKFMLNGGGPESFDSNLGNGNMMMGMGMGMDSNYFGIQDNRITGFNHQIQQMSPFIFGNGMLAGGGGGDPNSPSHERRNTSSTSTFNPNSSVDPSMMNTFQPSHNVPPQMSRFNQSNSPTHIQQQMQQLNPHTSTANYQAQLGVFLQQQAQQFGQQHHQQALIQAQALAYAQQQYVATIQAQQMQQQQQQHQVQRQFNGNSLGLSPSSISGSSSSAPSPDVNVNQMPPSIGVSLATAAPAVHLRASARELSSNGQINHNPQLLAADSAGSKPKASKKRKGSDVGQQAEAATQARFAGAPNGMPRMEVGSNATARAAIQRLKAKKQAENVAPTGHASNPTAHQSDPSVRVKNEREADRPSDPNSSDKPLRSQKKVAHNAIERRYRNNINDRISALRSAVPALHEIKAKAKGKGKGKGKNAAEDLVDGVAAATKLNKGVILGKATEYIHHLKKRETNLVAEVVALRELVTSLEGGEELLEIWQADFDQDQAKKDQEEAAAAGDSYDLEDEDEDEEEEDEDERPYKLQRTDTSRSPTSTSSGSSGRYMLAAFLGISLFGGAAEISTDTHVASSSIPAPTPIHAAGGRVLGAGHQLLKRANVPIIDTSAHHFDQVPTHALAFEIFRAFMVVAVVVFIFWPLVSKFFLRRSNSVKDNAKSSSNAERRRTMLEVLSRRNPSPSPSDLDQSLRTFLGAPQSRLSAALGLMVEAGRYALRRAPFGKIIEREKLTSLEKEHATVWLRLLEVESILREEAQASDLVRAHTIVKVANLRIPLQAPDSTNSALTPARINATLAVSLARSEGRNGRALRRRSLDNDSDRSTPRPQSWSMDAAHEFWIRAQRAMMMEEEDMEDVREESRARAATLGESASSSSGSTGWLSSVLRLGLEEALYLCPSQSDVSLAFQETAEKELEGIDGGLSSIALRALDTSPLLAIADAKHQRELAGVWAKLFGNLVRSTCPNAQGSTVNSFGEVAGPTANPLSDFIASSTSSGSFNMHIVTDLSSRAALTAQISRLAATAPPLTPSSSLSKTTLAAWALLVGNAPVARSLASKLALRGPGGEDPVTENCAAAHALVELVVGNSSAGVFASSQVAPSPADDVDALASAAIQWLSFLRQFNSRLQFAKQLASASAATSADEGQKTDLSGTPKPKQDLIYESFSAKAEAQADQRLVSSALKLRKLLSKAEPVTISLALRSAAAASIQRSNSQVEGDSDSSDSASTSTTSSATSSPTSVVTKEKRVADRRALKIQRQAMESELELEDARDSLTDILTSLGRKASKSVKISETSSNGRNTSWLRKVVEANGAQAVWDSEDEDSGVEVAVN